VQQNIVFFPAHLMLMRVAGRLLGGDAVGYRPPEMIISIASFSVRSVSGTCPRPHGDDVAGGAIWLLAAYRDFSSAAHRVALSIGDGRRLLPFLEAAVRPRIPAGACWSG
jgi:hypothetical protein